jgi:hypothetical protein
MKTQPAEVRRLHMPERVSTAARAVDILPFQGVVPTVDRDAVGSILL